jgi:hypothetical protein
VMPAYATGAHAKADIADRADREANMELRMG